MSDKNSKGNSEKANEVKRVWDILDPQPPDLLEPHRRYRMEGELLFYEKKKLRPRYVFLFNDIVLVTEKKDSGEKCVRVSLLAGCYFYCTNACTDTADMG